MIPQGYLTSYLYEPPTQYEMLQRHGLGMAGDAIAPWILDQLAVRLGQTRAPMDPQNTTVGLMRVVLEGYNWFWPISLSHVTAK